MEKTINNMPQSGIEIYTAPDNSIQLQVKLDQDTVWLTQEQMSLLFGRDRTVISRHIRNIYTERELSEDITCAKFAHMGIEGDQSYETTLYNLDVIISVGYLRHHWWNEAGQMAAVADNEHCGFYGYDGNGERAYKLTGSTELDTTLTDGSQMRMHLDNTVLYVNPYFIVTPTGYTKQYYNGMQHIATRIGELNYLPENIIDTSTLGMERLMNARSYMDTLFVRSVSLRPDTTATFVDIDGEAFPELQWQGVDSSLVWTLAIESDSDMLYPVLTKDISCLDPRVSGVYYYHSDHLGSAAWVTHGAQAVQFVHYMPFGEMWYNQQGSAYNERYKFTGKERDAETGYDYFGARYYASGNLSWLSVDPLADKYPNISPYAYAAWNPIKYVDPDGNRPLPIDRKYNGWTAKVDSWFGPRNTGLQGASTFHKGLDFNYSCGGDGDYGTPIFATHEGFAHLVDNLDGNAGRYVEITSADGTVRTRYMHLSAISVIEGQYVFEADKIGNMGGSGKGSEHRWKSHLHYEIQKRINGNWKSIDPVEGGEKSLDNILDPQLVIEVDNNLYYGGELPEIHVQTPQEL